MEAEQAIEVRDDKNTITDIAFGVAPELLGKPIATPIQRGIAITVDAFLVLLLTDLSPVFWALFAGVAFFQIGRKRDKKSWRMTRYMLRLIGAFTVFIASIILIDSVVSNTSFNFNDDVETPPKVERTNTSEMDDMSQAFTALGMTAEIVALSMLLEQEDCDQQCFEPQVKQLVEKMKNLGLERAKGISVLDEALAVELFDSAVEKQDYINQLWQQEVASKSEQTKEYEELESSEVTASNDSESTEQREQENTQPTYSVIEFGKAIIADLGLGFGWAALYFTVFSAWWRGQTPGKKLMGIRVIQLDGTYMSAWDSFGRYGGYGAGFATGLMGFLQIYWDDNRQAIQDKISATVVIKGDL